MSATIRKCPGRPPDEELKARRREEILETAMHVFARHGYQTADVQWIADELKISKGTVYHYFPSKEDCSSPPSIAAWNCSTNTSTPPPPGAPR
ncbi:MAG TPA: TetR/AcrR family transcriptional regulator [Tepidisphaeraceae bacterium]|nr:TetR/AcrR family transcriptional regulator [Tepidisphaeraceae bacterium]